MKKYTFEQFFDELNVILNDVEMPFGLYLVNEQTEVNYGNESDVNLDYCVEHNIPAHYANRGGGTIVCTKGNIGVAVVYSVKKGWQARNLSEYIVSYLSDKGLNCELDGNDVLVDGFKVASTYEHRVENHLDRIYLTAQISINQDIDAIKNICKKPMIKVPKALSEYGITTEEMVDIVNSWYKTNIE